MKSAIYRRETCRLCNGKKHELIVQLKPSPIADAYVLTSDRTQETYPLDLFLCVTCGHAQILDVIDPNILYRDYIYLTTSSLGLADHFKGYARGVLEKVQPAKNGLVVDIGSNDGTLLKHFKAHDMKVLGVEPAQEIARQATQSGVETLPAFFGSETADRVREKFGPAKIVTMNNLFANIDNLQDTVQGIRKILDTDGVFVFETFYFVDYLENLVFDFMYHEHLSYNTIMPLCSFFERNGMELIDVERVPTKGGSVRCMVQLAGGLRKKSPSVLKHVEYEEKIGIHRTGKLFSEFKKKIEVQKANLLEVLKDFRSQGKTIAAYGASATSTTLMYHFDLVDYLNFLIDDNPAKQNTLSPGCHIPVLSSASIEEKKPDVIVILAWRYADPIVRNSQKFLAQGGKMIVPLPEFRIV